MGCGASTSSHGDSSVQQRDASDESARAALEQALLDGDLQRIAASNLQLGESAAGGFNHQQRLEYLQWKRAQEARSSSRRDSDSD
jgi:hypothetical protein